MAYEEKLEKIGSLTASADLSTAQFKFVKVSGAGTVTVSAAITDNSIGVLQNKPASGGIAEIGVHGISKVRAGAPVAAGVEVMSDSTGRAVLAAGAGARVLGHTLEAAAAADEVISVLLLGNVRVI